MGRGGGCGAQQLWNPRPGSDPPGPRLAPASEGLPGSLAVAVEGRQRAVGAGRCGCQSQAGPAPRSSHGARLPGSAGVRGARRQGITRRACLPGAMVSAQTAGASRGETIGARVRTNGDHAGSPLHRTAQVTTPGLLRPPPLPSLAGPVVRGCRGINPRGAGEPRTAFCSPGIWGCPGVSRCRGKGGPAPPGTSRPRVQVWDVGRGLPAGAVGWQDHQSRQES